MRAVPRTLPKSSAPTLKEVAQLAGVSRATASRVFTESPRVSEEARRAVERAARRLRYVPNRAARSLVTRRSGAGIHRVIKANDSELQIGHADASWISWQSRQSRAVWSCIRSV